MSRLPIRQLVELIMRSGDIDSRFVSRDIMAEGARAHRFLQKNNRDLYDDYKSEVALSGEYSHGGVCYILEGRADGIFGQDGKYTIEEIKTTTLPLNLIDEESNVTHWAQAKCYAYIFAQQKQLTEISVRLTYFNLDNNETKRFDRDFIFDDLQGFVGMLIEKYAVWSSFTSEWQSIRDDSIKKAEFPYPSYRKGQRELAVAAYRTITGKEKLFVQAPTGIGKTISVLFPSIKAIGEGKGSKIFYLTAKTITRQVAEEALGIMRSNGLRMKTLTLTAKEKLCFCEKAVCNPDNCEYAKGHYDRINEAILDTIASCDDLSRITIESYARQHQVCPFEFSLDLSLLADCIICDYNYVFDPRVYLRRFFGEGSGEYIFLIDEAHNLVDRSREMFSAQVFKTGFSKIKKDYKGRKKTLDKVLNGINRYMIALRKQAEGLECLTIPKPEELIDLVNKFTAACELMLKEDRQLGEDNAFLQLYFDCLGFMTVADFYDERYVTLVEADREDVMVRLFCLDPSFLLREAFKRGSAAIMFSATLTPLMYFREILGGSPEDKILSLDSPFARDNLCIMIADRISTKYKNRELSREGVVQLIGSFVSQQKGNYIIYFPSYRYMQDVYEDFVGTFPEIRVVMQGAVMSEPEREQFLLRFEENPETTHVAFCVLGGIFSEGIDLKGNRLIGAAVVSVGLPQLSYRQDIIRDYFSQRNGMGYEYAYMYPGMNKVLQAAGRVIRSEGDRGAILLIDERYSRRDYKKLYPKHWQKRIEIRDSETLKEVLQCFWSIEP